MNTIDARSVLKGGAIIVVALAWNEAAKDVIKYLFPRASNNDGFANAIATLVYAIFVTLLVIIVISGYNFTITRINSDSYTPRQIRKFSSRPLSNSIIPKSA